MRSYYRHFCLRYTKPFSTLSNLFSDLSLSSPTPPPSSTRFKSIHKSLSDETDLQALVPKFKSSSHHRSFRSHEGIYYNTVHRLASANLHHSIADILDYQKQFIGPSNEGFAIRLMKLYGRSSMFDHARKLFDELPNLECPRTVRSFNALLTAALESKLFQKVIELLDTLPGEISVKPDASSYKILIRSYCEMGSLDSAVSVMETMDLKGVRPNLLIFNIVLNAFYKARPISDAEKIWAKMEEYNCTPDIYSYNAKLRGLVADGKKVEAVKLIGELESRGLKPDTFSFNAVIKGYCNDGNLEEAMRVFSELLNNDCAPNKWTFEALIPCFCEKGDLDLAAKLSTDSIRLRCSVNAGILQDVVDSLGKGARWEDAKKLVELGLSTDYGLYSGLKLPALG